MKENRNQLSQDLGPDYRFIGGGNGQPATVGEIMDALAELPRDAVIDNPSRYILSVYADDESYKGITPQLNNNYGEFNKSHYDVITTMAEYVAHNQGGINTPNDYAKLYDEFVASEYANDNTAMTRIDKRGPVEYFPANYQCILPAPMRCAIDLERRNNTDLVENMLEIDRRAIELKANIDIEAARQKYELMAEYNTQCDMHGMGAIMCQIVAEEASKK